MDFITLDHISRWYGAQQALKDVTLSLSPGRIGLLGPNGAGKSTLLKILLGLLPPSSGTGSVLGHALGQDGTALRRTIGYLRNNQDHMNFPEYRKQGLPVTSSLVESLIKEINYRVKGTEKFWDNPEGAEAILQLRAAVLSDDNRLQTFIMTRPGSATRCHEETEYRQAA